MNDAEFVAEVVLVSASGVLSPGPLFLANIIYGGKWVSLKELKSHMGTQS